MQNVDGELTLSDVDDAAKLNHRREEASLMPIEVYLLFANSNKEFAQQAN